MYNKRLINRRSVFKSGIGVLLGISGVATYKAMSQSQNVQSLDHPSRNFTVSGNLSLKERAAVKGLIYGSAIKYDQLYSETDLATHVKRECGMVVPEWELKWYVGQQSLRPTPDRFDFERADWMANFAKVNALLLRGHTLVWHESLPPWFKNKVNSQNAKQYLEQHITTVVKRYAGKIHSWDVVNEVIDLSDKRVDGLRISPWFKLLGTDYIDLAFRLAAKSDPNALLVYNDYGLDYDTPEADAKRAAVLNLLAGLKSRGTPIHAFGTQAHLTPGRNRKFNPEKLRQFLRDVANLGLKILITELDVSDKHLPLDIKVRDRIVAGVYEDYLSAALDEKAVIAVITWGLSDRYSWLSQYKPRPDRKPVRPLPLDDKMQHKLAWNAIARAFDNAPQR